MYNIILVSSIPLDRWHYEAQVYRVVIEFQVQGSCKQQGLVLFVKN